MAEIMIDGDNWIGVQCVLEEGVIRGIESPRGCLDINFCTVSSDAGARPLLVRSRADLESSPHLVRRIAVCLSVCLSV